MNNEPSNSKKEQGALPKEGSGLSGESSNHCDVDEDILGEGSSVVSHQDSVREVIGKRETKIVHLSKCMVVVVIFVVGALMGFITYSFLARAEKEEYRSQFDSMADEIISITHIRSRSVFDNLEQVGVSLTAQAIATKANWPFVYFGSWQVQGMISNQITGANTLTIHPLVQDRDRAAWERFSVYNQKWLRDSHAFDEHAHPMLYQREYYNDIMYDPRGESLRWNVTGIVPSIWKEGDDGKIVPLPKGSSDRYSPFWQRAPAVDFSPDTNKDLQSSDIFKNVIQGMLETDHPVMTEVTDATFLKQNYEQRFPSEEKNKPHIYLLSPIYDSLFANRTAVGFLSALFRFDNFFTNILPDTENGIIVVLDGSCGQTFSYIINGHKAEFLGVGNLGDPRYEHMRRDFEIAPFTLLEETEDNKYCQYSGRIYPSKEWGDKYFTDDPVDFAVAIVACFVVTSLVFVLYLFYVVQKRQQVVLDSATKANQVVYSLFPRNVRERLLEEVHANETKKVQHAASASQRRIQSQRKPACETSETIFGSAPIADFFPNTTVMFADMVGFTSWSSSREPSAVFTLLETVYHAMDMIARRRRVFKVETIGDCYVAVCGLPVPRADHALVMARFAHETNRKMRQLVRQMEGILGPDTAELAMRTGLHSGPVTAGVLRGDKGRFQLFGDTMNTTARIESTGEKNRIHLSQETANLLIQAGKNLWVEPRADKVIAKGKGELQTYWLAAGADVTGSLNGQNPNISISNLDYTDNSESLVAEEESGIFTLASLSKKKQRLVMWCVEILSRLLKQVIAQRLSVSGTQHTGKEPTWTHDSSTISEVRDILELPPFDAAAVKNPVNRDSVILPNAVSSQLELFVTNIAALYSDDNGFHNFEHAAHVMMTVTKFLSRMHNPCKKEASGAKFGESGELHLHKHSFGITSDALAQFACVISALIHDVDHSGLTNATLIKKEHPLAGRYKGISVAEQHSIDTAWHIFEQPEFQDLRSSIYTSESELRHFRSTVVTLVAATDITDKTLVKRRKDRWEAAFAEDAIKEECPQAATNRRATLALEHLMQASDVAHTMQHWHVFLKWNKRLFFEMYQAFKDGHTATDPTLFWFQGELDFFDFYVIPMAKKLRQCGVFGVTGDELIKYAEANRKEWEEKGQDSVKDYVRSFEAQLAGHNSELSIL